MVQKVDFSPPPPVRMMKVNVSAKALCIMQIEDMEINITIAQVEIKLEVLTVLRWMRPSLLCPGVLKELAHET